MIDAIEPRRPTRTGPEDTVIEAFSKDLSPAVGHVTSEPTSNKAEADAATSAREI